jgi:hypothetical protein
MVSTRGSGSLPVRTRPPTPQATTGVGEQACDIARTSPAVRVAGRLGRAQPSPEGHQQPRFSPGPKATTTWMYGH